jgi:predicted nuclease with TOPRIM domain|tara:strand:+ start:167 stop:460 length:294 start_codon:yes stop_codon:yes gene_type:complete
MSQGLNAVKEIRTFVENLQKKNNNVNLKNADLENELSQLKEDKKNLLNEITALNDKIKMLKLAKNIEGSGEEKNKDLKLMINEMVREIDKCVALINK